MSIEPAVGWLVAAVSGIGNLIQLVKGAKKTDAEIDQIRQQTSLDLLEEARELQAAMREQAQEWLDRMRNERDEFAAQNRLLLSRVDTLENTVEELAYQLATERSAREALARQLATERQARKTERKAWQVERQELLTKIDCLERKLKEYKRQLGVVQDATSTQPL